jgi:hypothetical protein
MDDGHKDADGDNAHDILLMSHGTRHPKTDPIKEVQQRHGEEHTATFHDKDGKPTTGRAVPTEIKDKDIDSRTPIRGTLGPHTRHDVKIQQRTST